MIMGHQIHIKVYSFIFYTQINRDAKKCFPAGIYLLKVNNRNTRARYEICSKYVKYIQKYVNYEHISHLVLVLLLLTLNM